MPESWTQHLKHVLGEETGGQVELFQEITTKNNKYWTMSPFLSSLLFIVYGAHVPFRGTRQNRTQDEALERRHTDVAESDASD